MRIVWLELRKGLRSPIIIGLFVVFTAFNLFLMLSERYIKDELQVLNTIVAETGHDMNGEGYAALGEYYNRELARMNAVTQDKIGRTYDSAAAFTESAPQLLDEQRPFAEDEVKLVQDLLVTEHYYLSVPMIADRYEALTMHDIAEYSLSIMLNPTSDAVDRMIYANYAELDKRFQQLRDGGEHLHLFFQGAIYRMHSFLYENMMGLLIYQLMVLAVLLTSLIMNHEFDHRTHQLMYATRRGRKLNLDKLGASMLATVIITAALITVNLTAYFLIYDYSGLWQVPISTGFLQEYEFPFIAWWPLTFGQHLLAVVGLMFICQFIFVMLTAFIAMFVRNSYFVCLLFLLLLGIGFTVSTVVPTTSVLIFWTYVNPFQLIQIPDLWFMMKGVFSTYPSYELLTVSVWIGALALLLWAGHYRFQKRNLY